MPTVPVVFETHSAVSGGAIVMPQLLVAVPATLLVESLTCAVKLKGPAVVGVPEISPVLGLRVNPRGSEPEVIEKL